MSRKYNPDHYHNSTNVLLRFIEGRRTWAIINALHIDEHEDVLDIGCGAGNMLEKIPGMRTGIDLSDTMIERSRNKLGDDVTLLKMSAENLQFEDESFDKIICSEVIEHVLHPQKVLKEIARTLRPGGLAAVSIPNERLIARTKWLLQHSGLRFLMKNQGETNVEDVDNEWHLHQGSMQLFEQWNRGLLPIVRTDKIPFHLLPFRYVFLLAKPHT